MSIVYVGGIKGVGKSFALRQIFDQSLSNDLTYERAKVAEVMLELSRNQGLIQEYSELESINPRLRTDIRTKAFKEILTSNERLIFDGHFSIPSVFGYEYGIPLKMVKKIDHLVLLYNQPEIVLGRRKKDMSKRREMYLEKVKLDLAVEEAFARFYARIIEEELKMIETDNEAPSKLIDFLRKVAKNG